MHRIFGVMIASLGLTALFLPAQAHAQMYAIISQTVANNMNTAWPRTCLSLEKPEKPKSVARFAAEAEPPLRTYLALAGAGSDPTPAYKREWSERWSFDGAVTQDLLAVRDPWAQRIERLETVGLVLGRSEVFGRGIWRAYSADGTLLGTYDAEMIRKTKGYAIGRLRLWSPEQQNRAMPLTPYCAEPGDHEAWVAAQAEKARPQKERDKTG